MSNITDLDEGECVEVVPTKMGSEELTKEEQENLRAEYCRVSEDKVKIDFMGDEFVVEYRFE